MRLSYKNRMMLKRIIVFFIAISLLLGEVQISSMPYVVYASEPETVETSEESTTQQVEDLGTIEEVTTEETTDETIEITTESTDVATTELLDTEQSITQEQQVETIDEVVLEDMVVSSNTFLTENTTINNLIINNDYTLDLNGYELIVEGNSTIKGNLIFEKGELTCYGNVNISSSAHVTMDNVNDYMMVYGNLTYYGESKLTAGKIEVKGNFTANNNFYAIDSHKVVFSGNGEQKISVSDEGEFGQVEIRNFSSAGITILYSFNYAQLADNDCVIKYADVGGERGYTLTEDTQYEGTYYLVSDILDLNGHTLTINGDLIHAGGTINVNGGQLIINGNYRAQSRTIDANNKVTYGKSTGTLNMTNENDYVYIDGCFISDTSMDHTGKLTEGVMEITDDVEIKNTYSKTSFFASDNHTVIMSGEEKQSVLIGQEGELNTTSNSHFANLVINNLSEDGVEFSSYVYVSNSVDVQAGVTSGVLAISSGTEFVKDYYQGDVYIYGSSNTFEHKINIVGDVTLSGSVTLSNNFSVDGNIAGEMGSSFIKSDGVSISVTGDSTYVDYKMSNSLDYVFVGGNLTLYNPENMYRGTLELKGNLSIEGTKALGEGHRFLLSGDSLQTVKSSVKMGILELQNYSTEGVYSDTPIAKYKLLRNGCKLTYGNVQGEFGWTLAEDYVYEGNLILIDDELNLNGHTLTVTGDIIQLSGTINTASGKLHILGDYRMQGFVGDIADDNYTDSSGYIVMGNNDYILVEGDMYYYSANKIEGGTIELKGNLYANNLNTSNKCNFLFSGTQEQKIGSSSSDYFNFANLEFSNTSIEGINIIGLVWVYKHIDDNTTQVNGTIRTKSQITFGDNVFQGSLYLNYERFVMPNLHIKGNLYNDYYLYINKGTTLKVDGNYTDDGWYTYVYGDFTVDGDCVLQSLTIAIINNGNLVVKGDLIIESNSVAELIMYGSDSYCLVEGDLVKSGKKGDLTLTDGVLEVKGNIELNGGVSAQEENTLLLTGDTLQTINAIGDVSWGTIELQNYSEEGVFSEKIFSKIKLIRNGCRLRYGDCQGEFGWTLSEDQTWEGDLIILDDTLDLNGHTLTVTGDLIQQSGNLKINGGKLVVNGDYRMQTISESDNGVTYGSSVSSLIMTNVNDYVLVEGDYIVSTLSSQEGCCTAGILEIKGNVRVDNAKQNNAVYFDKNHTLLLSGEDKQTISTTAPASKLHIGGVTLTNTSGKQIATNGNIKIYGCLSSNNYGFDKAIYIGSTASFKDDLYEGDIVIDERYTINKGEKIYLIGNININSTLNVIGTFVVDGNVFINSGNIEMANQSTYLKVNGDLNAQYKSVNLTKGTLEVTGNITSGGNITTSQNSLLLLTGQKEQIIDIPNYSSIGVLELRNTSKEGVYSDDYFCISELIENETIFTIGVADYQEGYTLEQDTVIAGDYYLGFGRLNLNGYTLTIEGDLIHAGGNIWINGGQLNISGDYVQNTKVLSGKKEEWKSSTGTLTMDSASDKLYVSGNMELHPKDHIGSSSGLTNGSIYLDGDFNYYLDNNPYKDKLFSTYENCNVYLQGVDQSITGHGCRFANLYIYTENSLNLSVGVTVTSKLVAECDDISGTVNIARFDILETNTYSGSLKVTDSDVLDASKNIKGNLTLSNDLDLNGFEICCNELSVNGNLAINGGRINCLGDCSIGINGTLVMQDNKDYICVGKDMGFYSRQDHTEKLTAGTLELKGDFTDSYKNFKASEDHVTILGVKYKDSGKEYIQSITFNYEDSSFNTLVLKKELEKYVFSHDVEDMAVEVIYDIEDITPPQPVNNIKATAIDMTSVTIQYEQEDKTATIGYVIYRNGEKIGSTGVLTYKDTDLEPDTTYSYQVYPVNSIYQQAETSPQLSVTTLADTESPSIPTNLSVTGVTGSSIAISWNSATDNRGVAGYEVYRDGECIQIITGADLKTSYKDSGLTDTNKHTYEVLAYDQAGNKSEKSVEVTGNTIMPVITKTDPIDYSQLNNRTQKLTLFYKNMGYGTGYTVDIMYREKGETQWIALDTSGVKSSAYNAQTYTASYDWDTSDLVGSEYEVKYLIKDEDGNSTSETVSYYVDNTAPALPTEFGIVSLSGVLKLSWSASISHDCDRYNIYRRVYDSGEEYKLIYTEYNNLIESYTDVEVEEGVFYEYAITAVDTSGNESVKSEAVKALVRPDEEEPVISEVSPETGKLSGNAQISITAKDNKELSAVTISYRAENSEQWIKLTDIATKGETVYCNLNTKSYPDGVYYFNFEAIDATGNKSGEEYTRRYEFDNTGISKVNITEVTAGATYVQIKWDDVPETDFAYFQVEQRVNGYYSNIARVDNVLGYTLEGLEPNSTYVFRVVAYDNMGNKGIYSDVKYVTTNDDNIAPVINAVYPTDTYQRNSIDLSVKATDNNRIDYASFYYSTDGENYIKAADVKNTNNIKGEVQLSYKLKLTNLPEGKLYIKYTVYDKAGNKNALTSDGKDIINEYIIDKTAPSSPSNLMAVSHDGYIGLSWDKPADTDISCYRVYRADVEDGIFVTLSDNLQNSTYNDANVEPGKSYIYKMVAVDKAGNISVDSNHCTASAARDKTAPCIAGISLNDGSVVGDKTALEIIARDNSSLSQIEIDIKDAEEGIWLNVDKKAASGSIYQTTLDLKLENMPEGEYTYRIKVVDKEGNESGYTERTFKLDTTPAVGDIAATSSDLCTRLTMTLPEDEDFTYVDIYRRKKAQEGEPEESFTKIYTGKATEYIDKDITPWQEYEYKLHSYDVVGNCHESDIVSAYGTDNDVISPVAVLPENVRVMEGMEIQLDGGESTDNVKVKSYAWSINDGATYTGRLITHTFKEAGEYTVTLKVTDMAGNSSTATTKVNVIKKDGAGTITITVVDTAGTPIPYAYVYLSDSLNSDKSYKTDGAGKVTISANRGDYKAAAYKSGYIPKDIDVTVSEYTDNAYTITIPTGEIVVGDFTIHKMSLQEMVEAGVDFSAPQNMHQVTMYIELTFAEQPIPVIYECVQCFSYSGMDSGSSGYVGDISGGPGGGGGEPEKRPQIVELAPQYSSVMEQPILVYVTTRQTVSWLKDMYSVELGVLNTADTKYVIEDSKATINLPQGLSLATTFENQDKTIEIGDIAGQERKTASWVVKGDIPGEYEITADFEGNLMPFNTPVEAQFTCNQTIDITDYKGLKITIMPEETAYTGATYYIQFSVTNETDKPLYNFSTSFGTYVAPGMISETYYVEPGSDKKELVDYYYGRTQVIEEMSALSQTPVLVGDEVLTIQTLNPGQTIYGTYSCAFPGVADPTEYYYKLIDSMVEILEGKDLGLTIELNPIEGHICKIIIKGGVADYTYGDPVDVATGAYLDSYEAIAITGRDILSLDMNYNSIYSSTKGELGMGWSHNFESYIVEDMGMLHYYTSPYACASFMNEDSLSGLKYGTAEGNSLTLSSDTGKDTITYRSITTGMDGYILTKNPDGTYTMTTPAGYIYEYGTDGKLARMTIEEGRSVSISHAPDQMIVTEDATGNRLKLDYLNGRLISVTDNTGRTASFAYTGDYLTTITNPIGETISYEYDEAGRLIKGKNHYGEAFVTNTYDEEGKVVKQLDDKGNEIGFVYTDTENGRITKCIAADGSVTTYESDKRGNITKITSPSGAVTSYTFDEYGNKVKAVDAYGNSYNYSYDEKGNLESYQSYDGDGVSFGYDESGNIISIAGVDGSSPGTYTYDEQGNIIHATDGETACSYTYDEYGNLTSLTREGKGTTSYTYDDKGIFLTSATSENGHTSYMDYDSRGNLIRTCDAMGAETRYEYDNMNRPVKIIYPNSGQVSYTYDLYGNVTSVTDPMGNVTSHAYDTAGRHISTTYADGSTESFAYDEMGRMILATAADGRSISYEYDVLGNVTKVTYPDGTYEEYAYDLLGQVSAITDISGNTTEFTYDSHGTLTGITSPEGQSIEATYGADNKITGITSGTGSNARYTYDQKGIVTSITDALGYTTTYDYSSWGELMSETDANGNTTTYEYDNAGQCTSVTAPDGLTTAVVYDPCGRVSEAYVDRGTEGKLSVSYTYDSMGNVSTYTDEMGNTTSYTYDLCGNLIKVTDSEGAATEYTYDCMGKVLQEKDASGIVVTYSYNKSDLVEKMVMTSPTGKEKTYTYTYDDMGRVLSVTDPSGNISSQAYDKAGNVTDIVYPEGGGISYTYDDYGRVTEEKLSIGTSSTYEYNADSLLSQYTNGRGQKTEYIYDDLGRITSFSDDIGTVSYTYDANGNVLKTTETTKDGKSSTISRTYDCMNRVTSYTDYKGNTVKYGYDELGNLITLTYPGGEIVRYDYDSIGRLTTVTDEEGFITSYTYDNAGRLHTTTKPDGSVETNTYDKLSRVTQKEVVAKDDTLISRYSYVYDSWGNIVSITYEDESEEGRTTTNSVASKGVTNSDGSKTVSMTYDSSNRMVTYNGEDVVYDNDGNMVYGPLNGEMVTFTYDCRNRLTSAGNTTYEYDAENIRTATETPEYREEYITDSVSDLSRVLVITREYKTEDKTDTEKYYYGNGLIYEKSSEVGVLVYHYNHLGSTTAVTDKDCKLVYSCDYGTYGELVSTTEYGTNTPIIRFLYNGQLGVMTDDNSLYYMRSRYYNPQIKRFINQDVLIGSIGNSNSLNRYSYVEGNPVSYTDPFGLSPYGNFGTFLNVMNLLSNIELSNEDKKLLRHAILDIVGTLPGGWIADVANALLYFKEGNPTEGWKSLCYAIPGTDLAAKATKYAAKFGKLSDKAELLIKSVDFIGHTGAIMFSASDFGNDVEYMIDKYMVGEAEFSYQTIIELVSLGGHGLQLSCFSRSFLDNVSSGAYDSIFTGLSEMDVNLKSLFGIGTDWDIRYDNRGSVTLPFGTEGGTNSNYILFNKTHKDSLPQPKGTGPNGGRLQSHHGLQQKWAMENLSKYGYDPSLAPTVTIETGQGMPHTTISNLQNARRDARVASGNGKWSSSLQDELSYIVSDFRAAGFSDSTISNVLEQQYRMLDKLGVPYERIKY